MFKFYQTLDYQGNMRNEKSQTLEMSDQKKWAIR